MSNRRVAIVTGGSRGIGRAIAEALAEDGFDLIVNYNSNKKAANLAEEHIRGQHPSIRCTFVSGDISQEDTRQRLFAAYDELKDESVLGVMVHNAGQEIGLTSTNARALPSSETLEFGHGSSDGLDLRHAKYYQDMFGNAFVDLCERSIARMQPGKGGSLIGISSPGCNSTQVPVPTYSANGMGKSMMEYASRIIAKTAGSKNINCNIVIPGYTRTEAWDGLAKQWGTTADVVLSDIAPKKVPMKRPASPKQIAEVVAFLCSTKGRYITGVSLPVDGGLHMTSPT